MLKPKRIYTQALEVQGRLRELGANLECLRQATEEYYYAWSRMTPNHPKIYGGFVGYSESIRSLRDDLSRPPFLWTSEDDCGASYVVSPDGKTSITVSSGDGNTGRFCSDGTTPPPRTKNDKGPRIQRAVRNNARLLNRCLIPAMEEDALLRLAQESKKQSRMTWVLLIFLDRQLREIRAELSVPRGLSDDDFIDQWDERIILPPINFGDNQAGNGWRESPLAPKSPEIKIEIKKVG